jgi:hypothetical protein
MAFLEQTVNGGTITTVGQEGDDVSACTVVRNTSGGMMQRRVVKSGGVNRFTYPPLPVSGERKWRGGGCKLGKPKWPRVVERRKRRCRCVVAWKATFFFFGVMHVFDL